MVLNFGQNFFANAPLVSDGGSMSVLEQGGLAGTGLVSVTYGGGETSEGYYFNMWDNDATTYFGFTKNSVATAEITCYITITYPEKINVKQLYVLYYLSSAAVLTITGTLQISDDGSTWTDLDENNVSNTSTYFNYNVANKQFKYLRMKFVYDNVGNDGIVKGRFYLISMIGA